MNKLIILLILLVPVLFTAGCTEDPENASAQGIQEIGIVENMTSLEQINTSVQEGPVFVKIGSEACGPCRQMKPILRDLAAEYTGKITVMSADMDLSPEIAAYFEVYYIPDSFVVVGIEDGKYVYMQRDGNITTDRSQAAFKGLFEKQDYEELVKRAILYYENVNAK